MDTKVGVVERLVAAGVKHIEAASFVSPKWVPQMAGSADVMRRVPRVPGVRYIVASLEVGVRTFDSSVSGLGGCPHATGVSGNVATEDVAYLLHDEMGFATGIDLAGLIDAGSYISTALGRRTSSRVARAMAPNTADAA